jgi:hypothetical protein
VVNELLIEEEEELGKYVVRLAERALQSGNVECKMRRGL